VNFRVHMDPAMSTFPPPYTIPTIFSWKRIQASCMLQKLWNSTTLQTEFLEKWRPENYIPWKIHTWITSSAILPVTRSHKGKWRVKPETQRFSMKHHSYKQCCAQSWFRLQMLCNYSPSYNHSKHRNYSGQGPRYKTH